MRIENIGRALRVTAGLLLLTPGLSAQADPHPPDSTSVIEGVVADADGEPLVDVLIVVMGQRARSLSDSAGAFRLERLAGDSARLRVRRLGYRPETAVVELAPGAVRRVRLLLDVEPVGAPGLSVELDRPNDPRLDGFRRRAAGSRGHFITGEEIRDRDPPGLTAILRQVPGVSVSRADAGPGQVSSRRPCELEYFLDGLRTTRLQLDQLRPFDVAGIEIYAGSSQVPPEFTRRGFCGAIVVWTRSPLSGAQNRRR